MKFDSKLKLKSSTKIKPMPENAMRPTAILWRNTDIKKNPKLLMIGGAAHRSCFMYDIMTDNWLVGPKLPVSHNITTNVCVNYKEEAIFTFIIDAKLTLKSAVLDLKTAEFIEFGTENTSKDMDWALELTLEQHGIDRFHVKCGVTMPNNKIAVLARGRTKGLALQITGLLLIFNVSKIDGKYKLELEEKQRVFSSIFSR